MADINYIEELDAIRSNLSGNRIIGTYDLMRDLDFNDDASYSNPANKSTYTTGNGWVPLGLWHTSYWGAIFNGHGFKISNLYMNNREGAGLFGIIDVCTIRDLGLINPVINPSPSSNLTEAGTLIGGIDPSGPGGGVLGTVLIENCYSEGGSTGNDDHVGGFMGICHMYATADVTVRNCYTTTAVIERGSFQDGFGIAGFVGTLNQVSAGGSVVFTNCYAAGSVTSGAPGTYSGGWCGFNNSTFTVTNCFWDTTTTGYATSTNGTGMTTANMKTLSNFSSWDISSETSYNYPTKWFMRDGKYYPKLSIQYKAYDTSGFINS